MTNTTRWLQAPTGGTVQTYTGVMDRLLIASIWPNEGVLGNGHLKVTQRAAGANMSVDVAPGSAAVTNDWISNGGAYHTNESATVNVAIPAAPPSGTRTHLVVEQINDPQSDGGSNYTSTPACIADTGSGATLPKSALQLAQVHVAAGQATVVTANITDTRVQAAGLPAYKTGSTSDTLSGAGRVTVTHGLGATAQQVFIQMTAGGNLSYVPVILANDDTTFIVEFINSTTGALGAGGQPVTFFWIVYR